MNALRLVMVSSRYWPLVGETERFIANLARQLRGQVSEITILTARWGSEWAAEAVHRETRMVRLPYAPRGGWNTFRYIRSVGRWLKEHARDLDVVYVTNVRQEAHAVLGALWGKQVAVVLRARGDDCRWFRSTHLGWRVKRRWTEADAIVAPTKSMTSELLASGCNSPHVYRIANGAEVAGPRTVGMRNAARTALAEVNHDLAVADYAPIAVWVGRLEEGQHLFELVEAWRALAARWPSSRLWLLGDGPLREALHARIVDCQLRYQVLLPGTFDELDDVFAAADVFVATTPGSDGGQFLLEAMAAQLPVVAADAPECRELVQADVHGVLVRPGEWGALTEAVGGLFDDPRLAEQYGAAARRRVQQAFPADRMAGEHLQLFQRVAGHRQQLVR